ncbi:phenylalanine--tRNA ligase subunit beta [Synechococcus sp. PCC 6312]|uniref:phenylalanine--tRNA ligase subunit beta n=1 Tax=Synechococcus sp. (strain ATCC 27167 / PCC 6312) TaxID=195253 RepID=UPI00029F00ED|nr:phenylalanine--tRNA ligase subunit beta [Synechococcus sp. PCC 6312]AFY61419.1 phenylalanyl-tRNA synthetase, beta subunit [Synechococcus sp. PCC 6312]
MRISLKWLREFVPFTDSPTDLASRLTLAGFEVEDIEDRTTWAEGVVVGKILTCEPHPNANKLRVCQVDIGEDDPYTIVCGAPNAAAGMLAPVAPPGTYLPQIDLKIRPTKLRGVLSSGMICSLAELGLAKESAGIHSFENTENSLKAGQDVRPLLGLDDVILDVTSTANRADALSMIGIAREVAALTQLPLRLPDVGEIKIPKSGQKLPYPLNVNLDIADPQACPAYIGTVIAGVKIGPSPAWFQERLVAAGMRPINNVVDITNYILLTWGQPLHAFDADRLQTLATTAQAPDLPAKTSKKASVSLDQAFSERPELTIGVRLAQAGETLKTLDGQDRTLTPNNLVITAEDYPIALAGIMGGAETEVHDGTVNLLLEAALFSPVAIRKSARAQGLRTEASTRYERGVNPAELFQACDHALDLIQTLTGGQIQSQVIFDQRPPLTRTLELRLSRLQQVLGPVDAPEEDIEDLAAEVVESTLKSLGFGLEPIAATASKDEERSPAWTVTVPPYRFRDIEREIDLIEEVARLYGYDRFIDTLPSKSELGYLPLEQSLTRAIRAACRGAGLTELVHYSWIRPGSDTTGKITVVNPLVAEFSALRTDIITNLLNALQFNLEQGNPPLNGFEIGRVFTQDDEGLWETDHLGGIISGDPLRGKWVRGAKASQPLSWYEAKGILTSIFDRLGLGVEYQPDRRDDRLHPGRTASLWLQGERLGTFGQLHPQLRQARDLPEAVYVFELDMEVLLDHLMQHQARQLFCPYSTYPATDRDLALYAPIEVSVSELERIMIKAATFGKQETLLESVELFDQYVGEGVPSGQRSLAFRLIYRASDRTLTEADVTPIHQAIRDALQDKFAVTLRS